MGLRGYSAHFELTNRHLTNSDIRFRPNLQCAKSGFRSSVVSGRNLTSRKADIAFRRKNWPSRLPNTGPIPKSLGAVAGRNFAGFLYINIYENNGNCDIL
jgi:hypothetical protein